MEEFEGYLSLGAAEVKQMGLLLGVGGVFGKGFEEGLPRRVRDVDKVQERRLHRHRAEPVSGALIDRHQRDYLRKCQHARVHEQKAEIWRERVCVCVVCV